MLIPRVSLRSLRERSHRPALVAALALGAVGLIVPVAVVSATAAPGVCNPLDATGGFTVMVEEDAALGNAETEGTFAVKGQLTWLRDYPVVHSTGRTPFAYELPRTADDRPVRVAAGSLAFGAPSNGELKITSQGRINDDQAGFIITGTKDWTYAWSRSGGQEIRLTDVNLQDAQTRVQITGPLEVEPLGADSHALAETWADANVKVDESEIDAIFAGYPELVANSQALAALDSSNPDVAELTLDPGSHGGARSVQLVAGRTNVLNVTAAQLPSGSVTLQWSGGVTPSADTPLIVNLLDGDGTTFNIPGLQGTEGENTDANPNPYAAYVLFNYAGTQDVTITGGKISGSILAPRAHVESTHNSPIEGQLVARQLVEPQGGGEIHHYAFAGCVTGLDVAAGGFSVAKVVENPDGLTGLPGSFTVEPDPVSRTPELRR